MAKAPHPSDSWLARVARSWAPVGLLGLVILGLSQVRPTLEITPHLTFKTTDGVVVHTQYQVVNASALCTLTLKAAGQAIRQACPGCAVTRMACDWDQTFLINPVWPSDQVFEFNGGRMIIRHEQASLTKSFCQSLEQAKISQGRCVGVPTAITQSALPALSRSSKPLQTWLSFYSSDLSRALFWAFIVSLATALAILLTQRCHLHWTGDHPHQGVQKVHTTSRPRIGGIAVLAGMTAGLVQLIWSNPMLSPFAVLSTLAALPVFLMGLVEDIQKSTSTSARFWSAIVSALLAWWLTGIALHRLDITVVDVWLNSLPAAIALSCLASAGLTNAVNIIDGQHGLAVGSGLTSLLGLAYIAQAQLDLSLALSIWVFCAALVGFFLVNYPTGKIFLGDAGAYLLGHLMACFAIALVVRNPSVSAWSVLVICGYPVIETVYSMIRRFRHKSRLDEPDRAHLHSLIKRKIVAINRWQQLTDDQRNALVAPTIWVPNALFVITAVYMDDWPEIGLSVFIVQALIYVVVHSLLGGTQRISVK
jgi:UDP-N-acetylmuramyl pentapeptide phosphotransferase/UDP-N-acetylglucosamine-1-phosphate transferase